MELFVSLNLLLILWKKMNILVSGEKIRYTNAQKICQKTEEEL